MRDADGNGVRDPGRFKCVKGIGWYIEEYGCCQVSLNLTDYRVSAVHEVLEGVREVAHNEGVVVTGSELVGLIPLEAMLDAGRFYLNRQGLNPGASEQELIETAIRSLGLRDLGEFDPAQRIIERCIASDGPLIQQTVRTFVDTLASDAPAPGGGSVASLCGAMAAGLAAMVGQLTTGKRGLESQFEAMNTMAIEAQALKEGFLHDVDADTAAFDQWMAARGMPKKTPEEKKVRAQAIRAARREAIDVPLRVLERTNATLKMVEIALNGNPNCLSDAGVGALTAAACAEGAWYNVYINLDGFRDVDAAAEYRRRADQALESALQHARQIGERVRRVCRGRILKRFSKHWKELLVGILCVGIYLTDRWSILSSSVHLLYDLNDAEYGFFRVGFQYENTPLSQILFDPETRFGFLKACRTVGHQVQGTLAIAGMELLVAMKLFGAMYSTLTLKTLALFNSTVALICWCWALRRGLRSLWVPVAFALLFTFSGPIFTKLSMLFWGTHELVVLLHGGLLCLTATWIARPVNPLRSSMRLFGIGILAALLTLCNYSLLMPGLFTMGWLAAAGGLHWSQRHRSWTGLGWIPVLFLVGLGGFFLTQSVVLRSMVLSGLDYPDRINWEHPFGLSGKVPKQGAQQPFLFEQGGNWLDSEKWSKEVVPNALPMTPTAPPNSAGAGPEIWVRWSILGAALWCSVSGSIWWIRGWFGPHIHPDAH